MTDPKTQSGTTPRPQSAEKENGKEKRVEAIRHVGPTLEAGGVSLPGGELPENRIAAEGLVEDTANMRAVTADRYDREAEAVGAEPLRTRLPGDTSSDPHTNVGPDNATTLNDTSRGPGSDSNPGASSARHRRKGRAA